MARERAVPVEQTDFFLTDEERRAVLLQQAVEPRFQGRWREIVVHRRADHDDVGVDEFLQQRLAQQRLRPQLRVHGNGAVPLLAHHLQQRRADVR